jgi:LysR family transcriptional regulator, glycine cleavage system transcriptional activator
MALRCFDASVRLNSFTRAAQEVHLTQGAVSHQVIALEEMLGVPLFVRKRSGLELTAPGRAYHQQVSMALRQIERATQELITNKGRGGTLNLSVASSFATSSRAIPRSR